MAYINNGKGALWRNKKKKTPKQPDFTGTITTPDGEKLFVSGWKQNTNGTSKPEIQLTCMEFKENFGKPKDTPRHMPEVNNDPIDFDDDIPF